MKPRRLHALADEPARRHGGRRRSSIDARVVREARLRAGLDQHVVGVVAQPPAVKSMLGAEP